MSSLSLCFLLFHQLTVVAVILVNREFSLDCFLLLVQQLTAVAVILEIHEFSLWNVFFF